MRNRLRKAWTAVGEALRSAGAAVGSQFGRDEVLVLVGAGLVTVALWPTLERASLLAPGTVFLWVALPSREAFVKRPPAAMAQRRRKD